MSEVTWVDKNICVCNNCGAFSEKPENIKHHETCRAGEGKKWVEFYTQKEDGEGR